MITDKFTLLELTDLALRVPEIGAVNFNILHTVLTFLIGELGFDKRRTSCYIEDEAMAQASITKDRLERGDRRRHSTSALTIEELKRRKEAMDRQLSAQGSTGAVASEGADAGVKEKPESAVPEEAEAPEIEDELPEGADAGEDEEREGALEEAEEREEGEVDSSAEDLEMDLEELKEVARDLMEAGAEELAGRAEQVTEALKVLQDEQLLDEEPAKVVEEMWRSININRRMEGAEKGLKMLSSIIDLLMDKVQQMEDGNRDVMDRSRSLLEEMEEYLAKMRAMEERFEMIDDRIEDVNTQREFEVERLEGVTDELKVEQGHTKKTVEKLESKQKNLEETVSFKEDIKQLKTEITEVVDTKSKDIRKVITDTEALLTKQADFVELMDRVERMDDYKVNKVELGKLADAAYLDNFLREHWEFRVELEEIKERITRLEERLDALEFKIQEDILKVMEAGFADIHSELEAVSEKLYKLDADEINDSFANLEEQTSMIMKELEAMKLISEQFHTESRINFNKIANLTDMLNHLNQTKMDKSKIYEMLEMKADLQLVMAKVEKSEFIAVMENVQDTLDRLTIKVKINEEEMNDGVTCLRHEMTLKMYTEDFITATQPMRNRIKALIYELERVKQISLTHLFPDAPGVVKCMSCRRGAQLAGPKYIGDANVEFLDEIQPGSPVRIATSTTSLHQPDIDIAHMKLPPIDLDSVPIPPSDKPRANDVCHLPVLFATARPQIGLVHEKKRREIDEKLAAYFATKPIRAVDGEFTRTLPQQRRLTFTKVRLMTQPEKEEVLLEGTNKRIYRGALYEDSVLTEKPSKERTDPKVDEPKKEQPDIKSLKEPKTKKGFIKPVIKARKKRSDDRVVSPTVVSLHVDHKPLIKPLPIAKSSQKVQLPSRQPDEMQKTSKD